MRNAVGVGVVRVGHDLEALRLRVGDRLFQLLVAPQTRIGREDLGPASVMPADVPPDEAKLGLVDALALEFIDDLFEPVERDRHVHLRLGLGRLFFHRGRDRLPAHADADFHRSRGVFQLGTVHDFFLQRFDRAVRLLELTVNARHVGVSRGLREEVELDLNVRVDLVVHQVGQIVEREDAVHAVFQVRDLFGLVAQAGQDDAHGAARGFDSEGRHHDGAVGVTPVFTLLERSVHAGAEDVKTVLAGLRGRPGVMDFNGFGSGRDLRGGDGQVLDVPFLFQLELPRLVGRSALEMKNGLNGFGALNDGFFFRDGKRGAEQKGEREEKLFHGRTLRRNDEL